MSRLAQLSFSFLLQGLLLMTYARAQPTATVPPVGSPPPNTTSGVLHLSPVETIATSLVANAFSPPFACDADGNLYLHSENLGVTAIRKLNPKGEQLAVYEPASDGDLIAKGASTVSFSVTPGGEVYALVPTLKDKEMGRYVVRFKGDGSSQTTIKLETGFPWFPVSIAVFTNGTMLVSGQEYDRKSTEPRLPFTGIFRADGKLLKELSLEDDNGIHQPAKAGDPQAVSSQAPNSNRAIINGQIEAAADGNLYLMRSLTPAIFYAVSPGGEVARRFTVNPGSPNFRPLQMHISGNRIAVLFWEPQTHEKIMKIVDLEGQDVATYDELLENGKPKLGVLGLAFACYTYHPERFTFLVTNQHQVELRLAEAR